MKVSFFYSKASCLGLVLKLILLVEQGQRGSDLAVGIKVGAHVGKELLLVGTEGLVKIDAVGTGLDSHLKK